VIEFQIPGSVPIMDEVVQVKLAKHLVDAVGSHDVRKRLIKIVSSASPEYRRAIFMHEVVEYIFRKMSCSFSSGYKELFILSHRDLDVFAAVLLQALDGASK